MTTTIDEVIIGPTSVHDFADLLLLTLLFWDYLRLWNFLTLKWKGKLTLHFG